MSLQEELLKNYEEILTSTGLVITEDGKVFSEGVGDTQIPVMVSNDEVLVLPTPQLLRDGNWEGLQPFHPLSENALRGESIILKKLRILVASRCATVLGSALEMLTHVAADTGMHSKLSPKASEFLDHAKNADEKTLKRLKSVIDKVSLTGDHRLLAFYFGRPGAQKKESYTRMCRIDFPILDEFQSKEPTIFGVKMRHDDKATIKGIFKWLLGLPQDTDAIDSNMLFELYGTGTHSLNAPYFYTLMTSYVKLVKQLNSKLKLFKKSHPEQVKELTTNIEWADFLENLGKYRDLIPALKGNEGAAATHPGRRAQTSEPVTAEAKPLSAPALRANLGINSQIGSAGNEVPASATPAVMAPPAPVTVTPPTAVPPPPEAAPLLTPRSNERVVSWSSVQGPTAPIGYQSNMQPVYQQPAPTLVNPNGRDILRQQQYQRYQQSPHAYYDPNVHASIPPAPSARQQYAAPVNNQFRTVQAPTNRRGGPIRW